MMDNAVNHTISIPVDTEHSGLRLAIMVVFVVGWLVAYLILNALIPNQGLNIIAILGGFAVTAFATQQIERVLKQRWPSGRRLDIDRNSIALIDRNGTQKIDPLQQVNVLLWRFTIRRRSRVPKGWYMVACALEQNEAYLPVYTFMSPESFDALRTSHFSVLASQKESERTERGDLRLMGEQRRLHAAENARWMGGAEMTNDDFVQYVRQLQEQFPQWMPSVL
jgi:hypothetical protein